VGSRAGLDAVEKRKNLLPLYQIMNRSSSARQNYDANMKIVRRLQNRLLTRTVLV
jgi:hypothetical protein